MENKLENICEAIVESREQEKAREEYQSLLAQNRKKLGYEPKEKQYEDFLDLVSSVGGELG